MSEPGKICRDIREIIEESPARNLARNAERPEIESHLKICVGCRESYDKALALAKALDQWTAPQPKKNIQANVMARIAQIEREKSAGRGASTFGDLLAALLSYRFRVPALAVAALIAVLVGSLSLNVALWSRSEARQPVQIAVPVETPLPPGASILKSVHNLTQPTATPLETMLPSVRYATTIPMLGGGVMDLTAGAYYPAIIVILGAPPVAGGQELSPPTYPSNLNLSPKS